MPKMIKELDLLCKYYKEYDDVFKKYSTKINFPEASFWVLYGAYIFEKPCTQYKLCSEWYYSKQTINSSVNKLVKDGMIELKPIPEDIRNKKEIVLTHKGEEFCEQYIKPVVEAETRAFLSLSKHEQELLLSLTKQHTDNLILEMNKLGGL